MDANISFTGNLGTDVDFVRKDNWCGARFRVAQTPRYMRDGAWIDGETTWLSVRVNGRLAENCKNSLTKGDPVVVVGRLRTQVWTTPKGCSASSRWFRPSQSVTICSGAGAR
ncbi:hypothetical protein ASQ49_10380 [Acidipropionibacterium acidipropionici]|nr:hypothetical protein ASQ49_10380 [Acidipropionibacterium acidipropionici]